jgi:hypothetical protein
LRGAGFEEEGEEDVEDEALAAVARRRVRGTVLRDEEEIKPAKDVRGSTRGALREPKEDEEARSRREELVVRFISPLAQIIEFESLTQNRKRKAQKNKKKLQKWADTRAQEEDNQGCMYKGYSAGTLVTTDHRFRVCCT